jgi:NitT/TauT family transport system substrate-binding protein
MGKGGALMRDLRERITQLPARRLAALLTLAVFLPLIPAGQSAGQTAGKLVVAIGTAPPDLTLHPYYYAQENGFYKAEGVEVQLNPYNGDATAMRALTAGEADLAASGLAIPLKAIEAGSRLKVVVATAPKLDYLLVAQKGIASAKDLEGKNVGISGPGAVSYQVPLLMIKAAGGDPGKVKFVAVGGSSARTLALIAKKIDAAVLNTSFASRTTKYDHLHSIGDAARDLPNFIYVVEVATERAIREKRAALQAFVTATLRGARWAMQNPEQAILISQKVLPDVAKDEIAAGVRAFAKSQYYNADGILRKEAWDFTVEELLKGGEIKQRLNYNEHVLTEFGQAAVAKLGPFKR